MGLGPTPNKRWFVATRATLEAIVLGTIWRSLP